MSDDGALQSDYWPSTPDRLLHFFCELEGQAIIAHHLK
jgi:hypothetical protein